MTKRRPYRQVSADEHRWMHFLRDRGASVQEISNNCARSTSTVLTWLGRPTSAPKPSLQRKSDVKRIAARRKQLKSVLDAKKRTAEGKIRPLCCSLAAIRSEMIRRFGVTSSRQTLHRDTVALGYKSYVRPKVCTTAPEDMKRRCAFARVHREHSRAADFVPARKLIFSDEKIFTCNDQSGHRMFVAPGQRAIPREDKRWGPRVMVWGAVGLGFQYFVILPKPKHDSGLVDELRLNTLTGQGYRQRVLPKFITEMQHLPGRRVFMQDGARAHTCRATLQYLARKGVRVLKQWPPRSPDLNPIENLWGEMQRRVSLLAPHDTQSLERALHAVFDDMKRNHQDLVDRFVLSFNRRCTHVYDRDGGW